MIDLLLNIGRTFDWLTPSVALIQDIYYGAECDINIPTGAGWSRSDIKRLFKRHGVKVWGLLYSLDGDALLFSVPKEQAEYAHYLLQHGGDPYYDEFEEYIHTSY